MDNSVTLKMIQEAREALKGIAEVTPIVTSTRLGKNLFIKSENLQKTGSFKIRGAYNKIRMLSPEEAKRGDIRVIKVPANDEAEKLGIERAANMVMLGAILKETSVAKFETIYEELEHMFSGRKARFLEANRKAVDLYL